MDIASQIQETVEEKALKLALQNSILTAKQESERRVVFVDSDIEEEMNCDFYSQINETAKSTTSDSSRVPELNDANDNIDSKLSTFSCVPAAARCSSGAAASDIVNLEAFRKPRERLSACIEPAPSNNKEEIERKEEATDQVDNDDEEEALRKALESSLITAKHDEKRRKVNAYYKEDEDGLEKAIRMSLNQDTDSNKGSMQQNQPGTKSLLRCDEFRYPEGSFICIEDHLLCLALVSETSPRNQVDKDAQTINLNNSSSSNPLSIQSSNIKSLLEARNGVDNQIKIVLNNITTELKHLYSTFVNNQESELVSSSGSIQNYNLAACGIKRKLSSAELENGSRNNRTGKIVDESPCNKKSTRPTNTLSHLYSILEGSALIPFIEAILQVNSFLEISDHAAVYSQVVSVIRELCLQPNLRPLLAPLPEHNTSIHHILKNLEQQANIMITRIDKMIYDDDASNLAKEFKTLVKEVGEALNSIGVKVDDNELASNSPSSSSLDSANNKHKSRLNASSPDTVAVQTVNDSGITYIGPSQEQNQLHNPYQRPSLQQDIVILPSSFKQPALNPPAPKGSTIYSTEQQDKIGLRPIVIDGSNIGFRHGMSMKFSVKGIEIVIEYFKRRGHQTIVAFLPQYRLGSDQAERNILQGLEKKGHVVFTPSRKVGSKAISSYDDRFILDFATEKQGIVISRDNFRDIYEDSQQHRETIEKRILMPTFVGDTLMFPDDPLGRNGPRLEEFLRF